MAIEQTLSIIKPNAVKKRCIGKILSHFEEGGLTIIAFKMVHLTQEQAEAFYAIHKNKPFFRSLITFMTSGPIVVAVLEGENAIMVNRQLMGVTNPKEAAPGTIRALFGESIEANAVHGSDSLETAKTEIAFFFPKEELSSPPGKKQK